MEVEKRGCNKKQKEKINDQISDLKKLIEALTI